MIVHRNSKSYNNVLEIFSRQFQNVKHLAQSISIFSSSATNDSKWGQYSNIFFGNKTRTFIWEYEEIC